MNFSDMQQGIEDARRTAQLADSQKEAMLLLVLGRLRTVTSYRGLDTLTKIKRELNSYNARYHNWK